MFQCFGLQLLIVLLGLIYSLSEFGIVINEPVLHLLSVLVRVMFQLAVPSTITAT